MSDLFTRKDNQKQASSGTQTMSPSRAAIRVVAGGYLLYLLYEIIKGGGLTDNTGWKLALMIAALVLFAVFGVVFIIQGVKSLVQMDRAQASGNEAVQSDEELSELPEENEVPEELITDEAEQSDEIPEPGSQEEN